MIHAACGMGDGSRCEAREGGREGVCECMEGPGRKVGS